MPNRIIKESICTSDNLDGLSYQEEVCFYRLLVNCDDYGRFDARPSILKARLFPLRISMVTEKQITGALQALIDHKLVQVYEVEGKRYLQVLTWEKHQQVRARRSKYPEPDIDSMQMISDVCGCTRNPIQSNPYPNPYPNPNAQKLKEYFESFWKCYPRKKSKGKAESTFFKVNPDEQMLATMLSAIERAKKSVDWTKDRGQYIPYPATWLNSRGWEDEIVENNNGHKFTNDKPVEGW
jgi:hypothetical protein